jgi:hypothetical protein
MATLGVGEIDARRVNFGPYSVTFKVTDNVGWQGARDPESRPLANDNG